MSNRFKIARILLSSALLLAAGFIKVSAQSADTNKDIIPVCIAYYNVENLFDTLHLSGESDLEFTPRGKNQWTTGRYLEKLDRIAEVISKIGVEVTPDGPAVIGLSEIENESVLQDLVKQERIKDRNYQVVFIEGRDKRVHNGFLFNPRYFELTDTTTKAVLMEELPDFRTRNHLIMSGKMLGEPMHFIVSHWPSRSGGEARSRPRRIAAAQAAREAIDSIKAIDPQAKVIYMGDLNDDPTDVSVAEHLNTSGNKNDLSEGQLYNPFVRYYNKGIGTLAYRDTWNLFDQIIVTQSLLDDDLSSFRFYKAEVFDKPYLRQSSGRFQGYPFRSFGSGVYLGGYSDHFPSYIFLIREI